jgi:glycosyltransferase involved in cell wall biosynthesis
MVDICFVNSLFPPDVKGGAENYVFRTAKALKNRGLNVSVITTQEYDGLDSLRPSKEMVDGIPVWKFYPVNIRHRSYDSSLSLPGKALWHQIDTVNPHASFIVGRLVDRLNPTVVHTNNLVGISTALARTVQKRDVRHVHTLHDYSLICPKTNLLREWTAPDDELIVCEKPPAPCRIYGGEKRKLIGNPDIVTAPSRHVIDIHRKHGFFKEVETIRVPLGIEEIAEEPPGEPDEPSILYVGKHFRAKGLDTLTECAGDLEDINFHFCGTGPYDELTEECAQRHENVTYHGFVSEQELQKLRRQVSVGVVPSIWMENSPMTIYENFAAGMPVIGSDIGGIPELIEEGERGWLFKPGDADALANVITQAVGDEATLAEMQRNALAWAREHTISHHVNSLLSDVYGNAEK